MFLVSIIFVIVMVMVVGALLSFLASEDGLNPLITENRRIEKQQNILYAMGVNDNDEGSAVFVASDKAGEEFSKYITKQLVIEGGNTSEDNNAYLIDVKKEQAKAKNGGTRRLPLFVGEKDGKTFYIAPIRGKGLWDAIWGLQGAYFDHKGETPGLGANIKQRYFMDDFIGEHLLSKNGDFKGITVAKGNTDPKNMDKTDNEVDAIAGATITGDGVSAMIKKDLKLYLPYFNSLKGK